MATAAPKSPFTTKKSSTSKSKVQTATDTPPAVAEAVDAFKNLKDQIKHLEGQSAIHKDTIMEFAGKEFVKRWMVGHDESSMKVLGKSNTHVNYTLMDKSGAITEEEKEEIAKRFGEETADALCVPDFSTLRFDAEVLAANYDAVLGALSALPEDVLNSLFKPMTLKAAPRAEIRQHASSADELGDLLKALKITSYIK